MAPTLNPVSWMISVAVGSATLVAALVSPAVRAGVILGMIAPLAAATISWVIVNHTFRQDPARLTGVMLRALAAKALFFLAYVAMAIRVLQVTPEPFVVSFAAYFVALYAMEAVFLRRLFSRAWQGARS
jgi:hypothetical protein